MSLILIYCQCKKLYNVRKSQPIMRDFRSSYDYSQMILMILQLWFIDSVIHWQFIWIKFWFFLLKKKKRRRRLMAINIKDT